MEEHFTLIGKRVPRIDTLSKVTGEAKYSADLKLPRMLVGKIRRSPLAHARILNIDTSRAERLKGVKAVVTGQDTAGVKWGVFRYTQDMELLPRDKVRYFGEEIAAVAAVDEDTAMEALDLIDVDLEELPAVYDPLEAMASEGPLIHEGFPNNINIHVEIMVGDLEKGFKESYLVREDTFTASEDCYFQGEPYAVVARFDDAGNLEIWMPNAGPHMKAKPLSNLLQMPLHKVRVRKITIGGAFGGRSEISPADYICALLARKSRRPVKVAYTREENTVNVRMGHALITTIRTGVDREGRVKARDITCYMDGGAYSSTGPIATSVPFLCMEQAYRMDNVRYNGFRIFTNKPIRGMIRMHGRSFACGIDLQLDMLGKELGIDPATMRLRNARQKGDYTPTGSYVQSCGLTECITRAAEKANWKEKYGKLPPWRGIGIGINSVQTGFPLGIRGGSQAFVKFNEDGGVTLISGVADNGQGNDNMLVQVVAEELGLDMGDVTLITADTEVTPNDPGTYSMVTTFAGGNAARLAAVDARNKIFEIAAEEMEANPADLVLKDKKVFVRGSPERFVPLKKIIRTGLMKGRPVSGEGHYSPKVDQRREWVKNPSGQLSETFSFGATIAEVEVDPETGKVKALEVTAAQDVGFALNPLVLEGQFEGSVAMGGHGGMLTEYHSWDGGRCLNPTQLEYKVPLAADMPPINSIIVESGDPSGPYGAKEAGMSIAMSAAQAYASAIADAIGATITDFPMTPDKILTAIENRKKGKHSDVT
ncbi:MAG: molybdopterin-dependent oxidoreductase [Deltaproteobacteria bacterium]|nr:molybdopterin-dependent oxidoreductase [Deltaproteobacteria bacterium]MBW2139107.1 molybdopterin-dependent oxidoreductase [Deltaproteobacteria bacterium]